MAWEYSEKTKQLFMDAVHGKPGTHLGEIEDPDGFGEHGSIVCGDAMRFTFRVERHPTDPVQDVIVDARYLTFGCTSAIAASEALCAIIEEGDFTPVEALKITNQDMTENVDGNLRSTQWALQSIIPPLVAQKSGNVLIEVSATGAKNFPGVPAYGATRAAAKYLINAVALDIAPHQVCLNGMGSMFCDYPGYRNSLGVTDNPEVLAEACKPIPMGRLGQPSEMAHMAASLLDGGCNYYTAQFVNMSGGWNGL